MWALILRYQIAGSAPEPSEKSKENTEAQKKRVSAKKLLLGWVNSSLPTSETTNFTNNWSNGSRLSALVDYCKPGLIPDHASLEPSNSLENVTRAMELAEKELGVPQVMHPTDMAVEKPDELSVMTYVSGFCGHDSAGQKSLLDWVNSKIPNDPMSNLTTDWEDGRALAQLIDALTEGGFPECEHMREEDGYKNCQEAMDVADNLLGGIKKTVSPELFAEGDMDHLTRSTYLNQYRFAEKPDKQTLLSTVKAVGPGITGGSAEKETNFIVRAPRIPQWAKVEAVVKTADGTKVPLTQKRTSSKAIQLQYTPEKEGDYTVEVTFNGQQVPGSVFNVTHVPPINVDGCVATGSGLNKGRVGKTAGFSVNCTQGGPGELQVDIEGPNGNLDVEVDEATVKNYGVSFTPQEAGDHYVSVQWDHTNIPASPFTCAVTDPKKCVATGAGLSRGNLGEEMAFAVKTDKAGEGELEVEVEGPNGLVPADVREGSGGVYNVTYFPKEAGPHSVNVLWSGSPVSGSPFSASMIMPADTSRCRVGPLPQGTLHANDAYSFEVDASDAGHGAMKASAHGPTVPEACTIRDKGNGHYEVEFTPAEVGPLKVDVAYGDDPLPGSAFEFDVNDPTKVKVNSGAMKNREYVIKQPIQFAVSAAHAGKGDLRATIRNPNGEDVIDMIDRGAGSYLFDYSPSSGGAHAINITFDGCEIPDVPIRIFVDDSNRADKIVVTQPMPGNIGAFLVNVPYEYRVMAVDAGVDELTMASAGARTGLKLAVEVKSNGDEQYSAVLVADKPDQYIVNIKWGGEHVPGSPFKLNVEGTPQVDMVTCTGPHYEIGSLDPITLDADAENAGAGKLSAMCIGDRTGDISVDVTEPVPKKYVVSFSPPSEDVFSLSILWQSENVNDSPFKVNIIAPDSTKCIVSGPEVPMDPSQPIALYVDASNAGNGKLSTSALGNKTGKKPVDVKETEENKFVLSFVPELSDFYTWDVQWSNKDVPGAPFHVNSTAANADKVMICEPPTAMLEAGQAIGICFDTSKGGKGTLTATCKGKSIGKIPISVSQRPSDDFKYDVKFSPPEPDIFMVNVLWSGINVKGSPFTINLMPVDVNKIKVIGPNMAHGPTGPVDLMMQMSGAGRGKVTGTCVGKKGEFVEVVIKETSTDMYELCFIPPRPDIYTFEVQYGGQTINGSPFAINTLPADSNMVKVTEPDAIDVMKMLVYKVDTSIAGSGKLNTTCRGDKSGPAQTTTAAEPSGQYKVSFMPRQTDLYRVSMEWNGAEVPGSPFKVDLRPPIAGNVKVSPLHIPDEVGNGKCIWVDLDCSDAGHGPLKGEARGKVAGKLPIDADKMSKANYRMKFLPTQPDVYTFAVAYGDSQVIGSPFKINLTLPRPDLVKHTRTTLPDFEGGPAAMFFNTSTAGRGEMSAVITNNSADPVTKKVEKLSFTEHKVTFIPDEPDVYTANVLWNGQPIAGSPFNVDTRPPLHPELIECGTPIYSDINTPVNLAVDTSRAGPGRVTAKCQDDKKREVHVDIKKPASPDDKYDISFTPEVHGNYQLSVFFEGDEIQDSPFPVNLVLILERADMVIIENVECSFIPKEFQGAPLSLDEPKAEEPHELTAYIGDPLNMEVSAEEEDKRKGEVMASVWGNKVGPTDVNVSKNPDGTFKVYFNPTVADRYTINVLLDDEPVPNSPFVINYIDRVDATKCKIFGLQDVPSIPQVNEPINFGVDTMRAGDGKLTVTSDGPSLEDESSQLQVDESMKEPGIHHVSYLPTAMGEHRVHLFWENDKIPGAPLVFKVGDVHKIQRYPGGKPVTIDINADSNKVGDFEAYAIQEDTGSKSKVKVKDKKKGVFKLSFQPKHPGLYSVHMLLKKKETPGSPYRIRYLGPPKPEGVVVQDSPKKGYVGHPIEFSINTEEAGTGELVVRVEGPKKISDDDITHQRCPVSKEVVYNVSYTPRSVGDHNFHITWSKAPIASSPLKVGVMDAKPEFQTALLAGGTNVVAVGSAAPVQILNGGPFLDLDTITAQCEGNKSAVLDVGVRKEEGKDDEYTIKFVPEVADDYNLSIKVNSEDIKGSPFFIKAVDKESLALDYSYPTGGLQSDIEAGRPVNILCSAPPDVEDINVKIEGPYGSCPPTVVSDSNGKVGVRFNPPLSGEYRVSSEREDITGIPCKIRASGKDPDASKVSILDKDMAVFESPLPFGKPARFRISTVDAGPGTLNITSKGPGKAQVKVLDNKDGTYTCNFNPSIAGKYHIDILWNDNHISGSPYQLLFKSKKNCIIAGLKLEEEEFKINVPHRFKLHCADVGEGVLEISTKPPSAAAIRLAPIVGKNGSYQCEILPKEVGNHEVIVQYNGKDIFGSPFNVQFDQRGDATKCRMIESTISGEEGGKERVNFVISTESAGKGKLTSYIERTSTKDQIPVTVTPQPENPEHFRVEFHPEEEEVEYLLTIKYDNNHIIGSPFKLMFGGDTADASRCSAKGEGIEVCIVDREAQFSVATPKPNQGELSVTIKGEKAIMPKMSPLGSMQTDVSYVADTPGMYDISVKWANEEIANSPFRVQCFSPADPGLWSVDSHPSELFLGSPLNFAVKASAGEPSNEGTMVVTALSASGKLIQGTSEKSEDGKVYDCTFDGASESGKHLVQVRLNGAHIKGSPFKLKFLTPPRPDMVKAYGAGLMDGYIGQEGNFTVETDKGGVGTLAVRVHGPKGAFKINMRRHPDNDRTILIRYDPTHVGNYTIDITWSEVHIPGSPFKVEFKEQ